MSKSMLKRLWFGKRLQQAEELLQPAEPVARELTQREREVLERARKRIDALAADDPEPVALLGFPRGAVPKFDLIYPDCTQLPDYEYRPIYAPEDHPSTHPPVQLADWNAGVQACIDVVLGGSFIHAESPIAREARLLAARLQELKRVDPPVQPTEPE